MFKCRLPTPQYYGSHFIYINMTTCIKHGATMLLQHVTLLFSSTGPTIAKAKRDGTANELSPSNEMYKT